MGYSGRPATPPPGHPAHGQHPADAAHDAWYRATVESLTWLNGDPLAIAREAFRAGYLAGREVSTERVQAPMYKTFTQLRPGHKWHVTITVCDRGGSAPRPVHTSTCDVIAPGARWHAVSPTAERGAVCGNCARMWELRPVE